MKNQLKNFMLTALILCNQGLSYAAQPEKSEDEKLAEQLQQEEVEEFGKEVEKLRMMRALHILALLSQMQQAAADDSSSDASSSSCPSSPVSAAPALQHQLADGSALAVRNTRNIDGQQYNQIPIEGDGNCLFYSLLLGAQVIGHPNAIAEQAQGPAYQFSAAAVADLRTSLVDYAFASADPTLQYSVAEEDDTGVLALTHQARQIRSGHAWGGGDQAAAFAQQQNVTVVLHSVHAAVPQVYNEGAPNGEIHIYHSGAHYELLIPVAAPAAAPVAAPVADEASSTTAPAGSSV